MIDVKTESLMFDPWPDAQGPGFIHPYPAAKAPIGWHLFTGFARSVLGGCLVMTLDQHPDRTSPADIAWLSHRVRERLMQRREAGEEHARLAVQELDRSNHSSGSLLREGVELLLSAGSVRMTLRGYRQNIERAEDYLARMVPAR